MGLNHDNYSGIKKKSFITRNIIFLECCRKPSRIFFMLVAIFLCYANLVSSKFLSEYLTHRALITTPYNIGSVLWRLFSTLEVVQYIGGITSVLWGDNLSTVGGSLQYCGGSLQYCGGCSVQWEDSFSTVGDSFSTVGGSFSTVEVAQYSGGITSVHAGG